MQITPEAESNAEGDTVQRTRSVVQKRLRRRCRDATAQVARRRHQQASNAIQVPDSKGEETMAAKPQLKIVAVGKVKESYWRDAIAEYSTRLTAHTTKFAIVEVADEPTPDNASPAQEAAIREREGERILAQIGPREYVIALDRTGKIFDSVRFAAHLEQSAASGAASALCFVIGGSLGLSTSVLTRADLTLSFGAFTFPHQLMRVILLEQLFRAGKINRGESYHK